MANRNIALCIILTIVTCGIYGLYWLYQINTAACQVNPNEWSTDGIIVILLSIVTCGIYAIYWNYKMGKAFSVLPGSSDNSMLYLILSIFGLSIVSFCIIQSDINRAVGGGNQ